MLTKEEILQVSDVETEVVDIPQWKGSVTVRGLTAQERDKYEDSLIDGKKRNMANARAKLFVMSVVDDTGKLMFTERDAIHLGRKSAAAVDLVFDVAMKLSGMTEKDIEELEKNSEAIQDDSLPTD